jgi:NAD(P)-dependent dehydrogenase (short-subunit alcohol dehydrogenase family)
MNRRALVTGGTRGIGREVVIKLSSIGYEVVYAGRSNPDPIAGAEFWSVDFLNETSTSIFLGRVLEAGIDVLVNNAGINRISPVQDIPLRDFDEIMTVNLRAPFRLIQSVLPSMLKKRWGRIVNVSSVFGVVSKAYRASYSASKFALDGLTAAVSAEHSSNGILINSVCPGFVLTDLTREVLGDAGMASISSTVPINRLADPKEIANAICWLCSPENSYMSGQKMVVDGGFVRV